jgi:CHASE2 domain-containing sensor protein
MPEGAPKTVRQVNRVAVNDAQSDVSRLDNAPEESQGASLNIASIAIGLFTTLILLAGILAFERTDLGYRVESYGYEVLQSYLPSFNPGEDMPVVVVDVGELGGGREGHPTPRAKLEEVVGAIARQNPRAIALNMDFSPNEEGGWQNNDDWEFLEFCLGLREKDVLVFAGVERGAESLPDEWLGDWRYKPLAAGMRFQSPNAHRVFLWVKPAESPEALPSISLALAESYRESLPKPPALLSPLLEKIEDYKHETERRDGNEFTYTKAFVNYSILETIEAASLAASSGVTIEDNKWRFRDKLVIVGLIRGSEVKIPVPGRGTAVPGVLLQASATYTLAKSPLFEFTRGSRILLNLLPQLACVAVLGFLRYRNRGNAAYDWHKQEWLAAVVTACLVFAGGIILVRYLGVLWFDFLLVVIALLLHPLIKQKIGARLLRRRVGKRERASAHGGAA